MVKGMIVAALIVGGWVWSKEEPMSVSDTIAKNVAELNEEKLMRKLAVEGWAQQQSEATLWRALHKESEKDLAEKKLENRCLRDSVRRQEAKIKAAELDLAEARRQIEVLNKRLEHPLEGTIFGPIFAPTPADLGIVQCALPSIQENVQPHQISRMPVIGVDWDVNGNPLPQPVVDEPPF